MVGLYTLTPLSKAMTQSRAHSLLEASANTASGFLVSLVASFVVFPALGMATTASQNFLAVAAFTFISILRSYVWRRVFNYLHSSGKL